MSFAASRRTFLLAGAALTACAQRPASTPSPLRFRELGRTGLKVTELGFGSEAVSDVSVFERAIDIGINFFDTARSYQGGNEERALGSVLRTKRDRVILATRSYADNAAQAAKDLDASLEALSTNHVDIWYLGQKDQPDKVTAEMLDVQRAAQKAGKLRFRGISTHRIGTMVDFILREKFDVVQIPYSYAVGTRRDPYKMDVTNLDSALDRLKAAGIGVVAMKVMAGGYRNPHARAGARPAAIRWALRTDRIQTTSVRMTDVDQLTENLESMTKPYTDADARLLAAYTDAVQPVLCRMCGACDGQCPRGTPVADAVRSVMYAESYGRFDLGLAALERSGARLACGDCRQCTVTCPNGVAVPERLHRARQLFC